MEILTVANFGQAFLIATAYTIAVMHLTKRTPYFFLHFMFVALIYMLGIITGLRLTANAVIVIACCVLMVKDNGYLKGFNYGVTIFALFQWVTALFGSVAFLLMYYVGVSINLQWALSVLLVVTAVALKFGLPYLFKNTSNKILRIDVTAKLFFVCFFNAFLPRFFHVLSMHLYSLLALALLVAAVMIAVGIEYIVTLERVRAVEHGQLRQILAWADRTISKYRGIEFPQFTQLEQIENPVVKALLYDFIDTAEKKGLSVKVAVKHSVRGVKLDIYDLFTVISAFLAETLTDANGYTDKGIEVHISGGKGFFFLINTGAEELANTQNDDRLRDGMLVELLQKNRNCNITLNISKVQKCICVI